MTNKDLFKEAIADAKAVREAALVNAKAALEEAFAPKLQSMISAKLQEMEEDEMEEEDELEENVDNYMDEEEMYESYDEEEEDEMEEGFLGARAEFDNENPDFNLFEDEEEEDELEEDFDLSEILAELDGEEEDELEEAKKKKKKKSEEEDIEGEEKEEKKYSSKKAKKASKETYPLDEEEDEDDAKISSLTVSELKDLISDIIHGEMEHEENETPSDEEHEPEHDSEEDQDEVDLEELLAELDEMDYEEMEEAKKKKKKMEPHGYKADGRYEDNPDYNKAEPYKKDELNEAIKTINTLRKELNEQNLLNAKLLYVNKIFKAKNLTESQKLRVIASFDKATTAKEAKMVFESLNTTLKTNAPKNSLKESMGFASKASGVAPKKAIVESDDVITRMQKLANIIK